MSEIARYFSSVDDRALYGICL